MAGQEEASVACLNPKKAAVQITCAALRPRGLEKRGGKQQAQQRDEDRTCAGTAQSWA